MAKEAYRLVRMLPSCAFEYLVSYEGGSFTWTQDHHKAMLFESWFDWVAAATAYWNTSGPEDLFHEKVLTIPRRAVCHA